MSRKPVRRTQSGPKNTSRAAGAPAPASAAATAPPSFYSPADDATAHTSSLTPPPSPLATAHVKAVREQAIPLDEGPGTADASLAAQPPAEGETLAEAVARIRGIRRPLGVYSQKLALDARHGYHRHWFNDQPGRVQEAQDNGWAHVKGPDGHPIRRVVGSGRDNGALYAYAMEIPEVIWQEDMAARHRAAAQVIESTKANPFKAAPGTAKPSDGGKFYSPTESAAPVQIVKAG